MTDSQTPLTMEKLRAAIESVEPLPWADLIPHCMLRESPYVDRDACFVVKNDDRYLVLAGRDFYGSMMVQVANRHYAPFPLRGAELAAMIVWSMMQEGKVS